MNNLIIKRSQLVEAQFTGTPSTGVKYSFTQVPNISRNNIIIYGFEVFTQTQLYTTPSNNVVVHSSAANSIVITFVDDNNVERIYQIPYYTLISAENGGFIRMVKPFILNLPKSYVQAVDVTNISENQVASINLYYSIVGE
jgi:hypothetical protein